MSGEYKPSVSLKRPTQWVNPVTQPYSPSVDLTPNAGNGYSTIPQYGGTFASGTNSIMDSIPTGGIDTGLDIAKKPFEASWMDNAFGFTNPDNGYKTGGWASPVLQTATAGMNAYLGLQQLNLMKDNLAFQKDAFSKQFENQRTTTNTQLADRQNARNASGSGYESTDSYMKNHGV